MSVSQYRGIRLNLLHWSSDSFPQAGKPAQQLLNAQIVDKADMAIAIFGPALGRLQMDMVPGRKKKLLDL